MRTALLVGFLAPFLAGSLASAAERTPGAVAAAALAVPGFDTLEQRFGFALGHVRVARLGLSVPSWRADYTLAWAGWGVGVSGAFALSGDDLGGVGLALRRGVLLGPGRLCGALELGIFRLEQGFPGDSRLVLYHGTSSAAELSYELGRGTTTRPFIAVRAELPWYTTEIETLTPGTGADGTAEVSLIEHRREWTPLYGVWAGIAL